MLIHDTILAAVSSPRPSSVPPDDSMLRRALGTMTSAHDGRDDRADHERGDGQHPSRDRGAIRALRRRRVVTARIAAVARLHRRPVARRRVAAAVLARRGRRWVVTAAGRGRRGWVVTAAGRGRRRVVTAAARMGRAMGAAGACNPRATAPTPAPSVVGSHRAVVAGPTPRTGDQTQGYPADRRSSARLSRMDNRRVSKPVAR